MWKEAQDKILGCGVVLCVSTVLLFLNNQIGDFLASSRSLLLLYLIGLPLVLQIATGKVDLASVGRCCIPAGIFGSFASAFSLRDDSNHKLSVKEDIACEARNRATCILMPRHKPN